MKDQRSKIKDQKSVKLKSGMKNSRLGFYLFICLFVYLCIGLFSKAHAEAVSFRVYPSLIKIGSKLPEELKTNIFVENLNDSPLELEAQIRLFKASPKADGSLEYLKMGENPDGIINKIRLLSKDNQISGLTLGPKQLTQITVNILPDAKNSNKDYYFSVIFVSKSKTYQSQPGTGNPNQTSFSTISSGVASNVLLSIHPKIDGIGSKSAPQTGTGIEEFTGPSFVQKGPIAFSVKVQNEGLSYISPKGTIYIKNMFGQLIGKVDIPPQDILSNSNRYLSAQSAVSSQQSAVPSVVWPESFLLGFYSADLSLQPTPDSPALTKTVHFTAFPLQLAIILTIALVIFIAIRKRVKAKMAKG